MNSSNLIYILRNISSKKEFKNYLVDLIFKNAKNKEEAFLNKYIQIPQEENIVLNQAFYG